MPPMATSGRSVRLWALPDAVEPDGLARALADGGSREHRANRDVVHAHRHRLNNLGVRVVRAAN